MSEDKSKGSHKWAKGQSGNLNGRPKGKSNKIPSDKKIIEDWKKGHNAAFIKLMELMTDEKSSEKTQMTCAIKILDTNYQIIKDQEKVSLKKKTKDDEGETKTENVFTAPVLKIT